MMLLEGQQCSHYRLIRLLKQGGMGQVYQAEDLSLQRQVAIKVIRIDFAHINDQAAMQEAAHLFSREALAIAQLDHNHILPLYDSGEEYINDTKVMYMVMPLRHEGSFADWLQAHTGGDGLPLAGVERVVRQAAEALQHAHDRQIIHKDVKPSNFLVREHAEHLSQLNLQLADFGVAKVMRLTSESQVIRGTPPYMAPEQWEGHPVPATDQYALAMMAYELLTGRHPFHNRGYQQMQLWYQHMHTRPAAPSTINPTIPHEVDEVILRALAKNPQNRFSSISTFAHAFRRAVLNSGNIQQELTVSMLEAQRGANRLVLLPDGRKVPVPIPAGTYQGQIMRLESYGYPTTYDGPRGALILTVTMMPSLEETIVPSVDHIAPTVPISPPSKGISYKDVPSVPSVVPTIQKYRIGRNKKLRLILPLFLVLFVGVGAICNVTINQIKANALSNTHEFATVTANNATATKTTLVANAATTKTAVVASTATVQAQATMTTIQNNPYPSYLPGNGQLALYDPLKDDSEGYQWLPITPPASSTLNNNCAFNGNGLDVSVEGDATNKIFFHPCIANIPTFGDFAYEVHMTMLAGNCGGMIMRGNAESFYYFIVCQGGHYRFVKYINDQTPAVILKDVNSPSINMLLNQDNFIAIWAKGMTMNLYWNGLLVDSIQDPSYNAGQIGVLVRSQNLNVRTEAVFSNARVWMLT
jgi:eukaryotic-like serine/threonine-protein kinase